MNVRKIIKRSVYCKHFKQNYSVLCRHPGNKLLRTHYYSVHGQRGIAIIFRALRGALRIRYIILGSAVGGGVQLSKVLIECFSCFCEVLLFSCNFIEILLFLCLSIFLFV